MSVVPDLEIFRRALASYATPIAAAWLFGSRARGDERPESDIDVAVLFSSDPARTFEGLHLDLQASLEAVSGVPIDLVVLNRAPVDLAWRVLRDGRLILESDSVARVRFEVRTRNEFWDLEPILAEYRASSISRKDASSLTGSRDGPPNE